MKQLLLTILLLSCIYAKNEHKKKETQQYKTNNVESIVNDWANKQNFSGVVSVSRADRTLYQQAFGLADRSNKRQNTTTTRFAIASGTKMLTALAIGKLIDQGDLSFETRASEIIDNLPNLSDSVTIRHLLNHTSGVYDYLDAELIKDYAAYELPIPPYKLRTCSDYLPMLSGKTKFNAGERFAYSNGGYILLGIIIEKLTNRTYREYVETEILGPLNMNLSGFFAFNNLPENCALNYLNENSGNETNMYKLPIVGGSDGGVFVTANDISRLWNAFKNKEILSDTLTKEFLTARVVVDGNLSYGLGFWIWQEKDREPVLFLAGSDIGVNFQSNLLADGSIITIVTNTGKDILPLMMEIEKSIVN